MVNCDSINYMNGLNMRKFFFVLIHFLLIGQSHELCAYKMPLLNNIYHTIGRSISTNNGWWSRSHEKLQNGLVEAENHDVDCSEVIKLQKKIGKYVQHDPYLQELNLKLRSYTDNIKKYKNENSSTKIDDIVLPSTTISAINRYVDAIITNKETDFSWQMKEYGAVQGAFSCAANLCMPKNMQSYLGAGLSIVGLEMLRLRLQSRSTPAATSNITVNVPANAQLTMQNNSSEMQNIAKMIIVCSLVAGTTIAATQWYTSFTSRQQREDQLALWIQQLQNHNLAMVNDNRNKNTNEVVNTIAPKVDELGDAIDKYYKKNQKELWCVRTSITDLHTTLLNHHNENQEKFDQAHKHRQEMFDSLNQLRKEYVKWLLDDEQHKSGTRKITDSIKETLTDLNDKYTVDSRDVKKSLVVIETKLEQVLQNQSSASETIQE